MNANQIASAIMNDLFAGDLILPSNNSFISIEQLTDEVLETRCSVIKDFYLNNLLKKEDFLVAINCIEVDCKDQNKCSCFKDNIDAKTAKHFEIPQLMPGLGSDALTFVGSTDRSQSFKIYYSLEAVEYQKHYQKYRRKYKPRPYVYIERTPNENGMYDCWVFNAPYIKHLAVIGIFKDLNQLEQYNCCQENNYLEMGSISEEIKNRILSKKIKLYRTPVYRIPQSV